ncbi:MULTISPECIES: LytTR family DNA-binding domain-containing protein [Emticicia]|uniref:LytR/AlgR family response regulator transcription factor n=1 Tax=Emticicia TaxID=312278 RepID=UPI0020A03B5A|nr:MULTISPECIES: LytTR family DNA-binding domain-containing protein [Emticicia]UTA68017.1 LytTR family transcriptional regulator [Emticicia sp. 21SJ11W-3]
MSKLIYKTPFSTEGFKVVQQMESQTAVENLSMRVAGKRNMVNLSDILYLKSAKNYTIFKLADGREIISSKTLRIFEEELNEIVNFVRLHRSYIINLEHVKDLYFNCRGGEVLIQDEKIVISRRKAADFRRKYRKYLRTTGQNVSSTIKLKTTIRMS